MSEEKRKLFEKLRSQIKEKVESLILKIEVVNLKT
jgi:hypothetical protein